MVLSNPFAMAALKQRPEDQRLPKGDEADVDAQSLVIDDIVQRRSLGISRYGQALLPFNGRDSLRDIYEECLDLTIYLRSLMQMTESDRESLRKVVARVVDTVGTLAVAPTNGEVYTNPGVLAGEIVDAVLGWVAGQRMNHNPYDVPRCCCWALTDASRPHKPYCPVYEGHRG